jgi:hypothetical protein
VRSDPNRFDKLARVFKVCSLVAARRAPDFDLITQDAFREFYQNFQTAAHQAKKSDGGSFHDTQNVRLGRRFSVAVVNAVKEGRIP